VQYLKTDTLDVKLRSNRKTKNQRVGQVVKSPRKLGSILGPDSAEHPLGLCYKTQNRAKRFNRLDHRNCFGTRGSEVQILSPRPYLVDSVDSILAVSASF
jgi:hypothetical protein